MIAIGTVRGRLSAFRHRLALSTHRFAGDEEGAIIAWFLFMVIGTVLAVGLAIDTMQTEVRRSFLQNLTDRAILAAADLEQERDAEAVVRDYFTRSGLDGSLVEIETDLASSAKVVSASMQEDVETIFLDWVGIETLPAPAGGTATESVTNVEISLVLDISGSMRFDDRITPLREAAKNFVDLVLEGDRAGGTTITIVPYAGATNPGPVLFDALGGTREHTDSSCLFLEDDDFTHTGLPKYSSRQIPHFHKWAIAPAYMDWGWCPSDATAILPMSNDPDTLKAYIDGMRLHDGTGTMFGMKYGLAFLDPDSEPTLDALVTAGEITGPGVDRPLPWSDTSTDKYIVLMTDGKITDQFQPVHTAFRDPDGDDEDNEAGDADDIDGIDHAKLNAEVETDFQGSIGGATRVAARSRNLANFYKACGLAKSKGVIVYTIAFEAPAAAAEEMRNCASYTTHFYEVGQLEIGAAFSSIARQISKLRLTQ
jgi:Flp pilus assembly protein TadG